MAIDGVNHTARAAGQLFCLVDLGDGDGLRRNSETDLTPRIPFSLDPGWYAGYWYGDRSRSTWLQARNIFRCSRAIARRVAENMRLSNVVQRYFPFRPSRPEASSW